MHDCDSMVPSEGQPEEGSSLEFFRGARPGNATAPEGLRKASSRPQQCAERANDARQIRLVAAQFQRSHTVLDHPDNGDEARYPDRSACYSKGLPHDGQGIVDPIAYERLREALTTGKSEDFARIPLGGSRPLVEPQMAFAFQSEGADPQASAIRPAPRFDGPETGGEMEELYWMALARDVAFSDYDSSPLIAQAVGRLNQLRVHRGARTEGFATTETAFRDALPGAMRGPYISQFLLKDVPYGAHTIVQRIRARVPGDDRLTSLDEWLDIQNGHAPTRAELFDDLPRFVRCGRDLAELVHRDPPVQAALDTALILLAEGMDSAPLGALEVSSMLGLFASLALRAQWFQKWRVHRRLRPEEFAGRVQMRLKGGTFFPVDAELLGSPVLDQIFGRNQSLNGGAGTYLLPQAFPEGCPLDPSYGASHSTIIAATVTFLKALFFDQEIRDPVQPSPDGTSLEPYDDALFVMDELDKLVANIGLGRLFAGVQWRSDHDAAVRLGEIVAIRALQDLARCHPELSQGFSLRTFGGNTITITKNGPEFTNHATCIEAFSLIDGASCVPLPGFVPLHNGAVIERAKLPPRLAVQAVTFPQKIGSVRFNIDGVDITPESLSPYRLLPAQAPDLFTHGAHVLTATPFSGTRGAGLGGVPLTIRYTVV
jgi:hypothetical protein